MPGSPRDKRMGRTHQTEQERSHRSNTSLSMAQAGQLKHATLGAGPHLTGNNSRAATEKDEDSIAQVDRGPRFTRTKAQPQVNGTAQEVKTSTQDVKSSIQEVKTSTQDVKTSTRDVKSSTGRKRTRDHSQASPQFIDHTTGAKVQPNTQETGVKTQPYAEGTGDETHLNADATGADVTAPIESTSAATQHLGTRKTHDEVQSESQGTGGEAQSGRQVVVDQPADVTSGDPSPSGAKSVGHGYDIQRRAVARSFPPVRRRTRNKPSSPHSTPGPCASAEGGDGGGKGSNTENMDANKMHGAPGCRSKVESGGVKGKGKKAGRSLFCEADAAQVAKADLSAAYDQFIITKDKRPRFMELDMAVSIDPFRLVGRQVMVHWPDDDAWYRGTVADYIEATGQHKVEYVDGDKETLFMSMERVRLLMHPLEVLPAPSATAVKNASHKLVKRANDLEQAQERKSARKNGLTEKAAKPPAGRNPKEDGPSPEEYRKRIQELTQVSEMLKAGLGSVGEQEPQGGFLLGDVVWAKVRKWPDWPAIVVSTVEAGHAGAGKAKAHSLAVRFLGSCDYNIMDVSMVTGWLDGLERGHHLTPGRHAKLFQQALYEARMYLKDGELPGGMLSDAESDEELDSDTQLAEEAKAKLKDERDAQDAARRNGGATSTSQPAMKPIKIGPKVMLLSLGEVNYIHPSYHTEKWIFPVGYKVRRLMISPLYKEEVPHMFEILEGRDGPIFRITPPEGPALEAPTASKAVMLVYKDSNATMRELGPGPAFFGLTNQRVMKMLQQLPGVEKCDKFKGWLHSPPPRQPVDENLARARLAAAASMQRLPSNVEVVLPKRLHEGRCHVCFEDDESDGNHLVQCDRCRVFVHMECYGVQHPPDGRLWMCDTCQLGLDTPPACALCPVQGGAMQQSSDGRWAHTACVLWIPETSINRTGPKVVLEGLDQIPAARQKLRCSCCRQVYGACVQCAGSKSCVTAFHPLCAREKGLAVEWIEEEDYESGHSSNEEEEDKRMMCSPGKRKGLSSAVSSKGSRTEGTLAGNGIRLMCYCTRHTPKTALAPNKWRITAEHTATVDQAVPSRSTCGMNSSAPSAAVEDHAYGCARCVPLTVHERNRRTQTSTSGQSIPYLVTGRKRSRAGLPPSGWRKLEYQSVTPSVLSTTERFREMQDTVGLRLTFGKSAIHGLGLFCKRDHKSGDMVIEYAGERIRHSVADVRERTLYNQIVGAGTYVFGLSDSDCVDATRRGSLAHLINHSCQPNCYSRTITVLNHKTGSCQDHVVIFARRNLVAGEELSYDYRFDSTTMLPCGCCAPRCRGFVNVPPEPDFELAPRHLLVPYKEELSKRQRLQDMQCKQQTRGKRQR